MYKTFSGKLNFLCNFYQFPFVFEGKEYKTAEHAFQAAKTLDEDKKEGIRNAFTPGLAKKFGRKVQIRKDWEDIKLEIMYEILKAKFSHPTMKKRLLETGDMELKEGNSWHDTFWEVDIKTGIGENNLGKILMRIRKELSDKKSKDVEPK